MRFSPRLVLVLVAILLLLTLAVEPAAAMDRQICWVKIYEYPGLRYPYPCNL